MEVGEKVTGCKVRCGRMKMKVVWKEKGVGSEKWRHVLKGRGLSAV